jgi:hypothetical protein
MTLAGALGIPGDSTGGGEPLPHYGACNRYDDSGCD